MEDKMDLLNECINWIEIQVIKGNHKWCWKGDIINELWFLEWKNKFDCVMFRFLD